MDVCRFKLKSGPELCDPSTHGAELGLPPSQAMALPDDGQSWDTELRTLAVMLKDRGYTQVKPQCHGEDPVLLCTCRDTKAELTFVFLSRETKVGVRTVRKMRADSAAAGSSHIILLSKEGLTPFAARELGEMEGNADVEVFKKPELCMPITHHCLVPLHTPLTRGQKQQLLSELGCRANQLPKLKESDPVAKYLHLAPGTVVKISRRIGTLEAEPYFRIVV